MCRPFAVGARARLRGPAGARARVAQVLSGVCQRGRVGPEPRRLELGCWPRFPPGTLPGGASAFVGA
eukprot:9915133-Lingulodinium_polyedra.AAC.1